MLDRAYLARLMDAPLDSDLRGWLLAVVVGAMTPTERRDERDRWIRAAAALVPGAAWTRARRLRAMAVEIARALPAHPDVGTARGCVAMALLVCPGRTPSQKTLGRIVDTLGLSCPRDT